MAFFKERARCWETIEAVMDAKRVERLKQIIAESMGDTEQDGGFDEETSHPLIDLLMGLFRGAVFRHVWGALKQPIKEPTETPTSTLALMGRFPSLMGRFPTLMGRFTDFVLRGRFTSWKSTGKQPIKKRGIKRSLNALHFLN